MAKIKRSGLILGKQVYFQVRTLSFGECNWLCRRMSVLTSMFIFCSFSWCFCYRFYHSQSPLNHYLGNQWFEDGHGLKLKINGLKISIRGVDRFSLEDDSRMLKQHQYVYIVAIEFESLFQKPFWSTTLENHFSYSLWITNWNYFKNDT